nr:MAG TPA: hypothetical protein [Caudoviricetes sp.]
MNIYLHNVVCNFGELLNIIARHAILKNSSKLILFSIMCIVKTAKYVYP